MEPKLLLLDEPLSNLDAKLRDAMRFELKRLQRELRITTVYVTHDQSEALALSHKIAVMNEGRIQQIGTPREIFRQPNTRYVAEFVGGSTVFAGEVVDVDGGLTKLRSPLGSFTVASGTQPPSVGDQAEFALHADQVTLEPGGGSAAGDNHVKGTLFGREFVGSTVKFLIELEDGTELQIHTGEKDSSEFTVDLGDPVSASWTPAATYLLPGKAA
jgi:iron(III) transport system ATP-binding protein